MDLSGDTFYAKKEEECNHILSAIPPFVTSLDLRGCNMGYRTRDSIIYLLNTIPPSVTSLNLGGTGLMNKTVRELEFISRSLKHIICIEAYDLLKEQLAALNRYNGFHGKKAIHQALDRHLGGDLSSLVLEYSTSSSPKDIRNILITQEAHKSYVTSIKTTIMHATKSGAPIVLGLLAGFCVYYFREPSSQSVFSVP